MFPEHRDLITKLRQSDPHFKKLFDQHNDLDHQIKNIEEGSTSGTKEDLNKLKKQKLGLKDDLYEVIKKYRNQNA
jgi:uncharacterized protein